MARQDFGTFNAFHNSPLTGHDPMGFWVLVCVLQAPAVQLL
jgi:hypothetical protein